MALYVDSALIKPQSGHETKSKYEGILSYNTTGIKDGGGFVKANLPITYKSKSVGEFREYIENLKKIDTEEKEQTTEMFGKENPTLADELEEQPFKPGPGHR